MAVDSGDQLDSPAGWRVVSGTHAVTAVTFGSVYAFSALFPGLAEEFDASRGQIAFVFALAAFCYYGLGAIAGQLADRWPVRRMVVIAIVVMVLGYVAAAFSQSLLGLYNAYSIAGGVGIGMSYVPALGAVQSWFVRRRALASGIAIAGLGVGTLVLPALTGVLIPVLGWRGCLLLLAGIVAVVGGAAAVFVRQREMSRSAAGIPDEEPPALRFARPRDVWRRRSFPLFYFVVVLGSFCVFIPYVHLVPAAQDLGLSLEAGTSLIAVIGVGNVIGRFVLVGLGDLIPARYLLAILTAAVAGSFVFWSFADNYVMLAVFAFVFGAAYGGCVGSTPSLLSSCSVLNASAQCWGIFTREWGSRPSSVRRLRA
ncbi:MFS transporter [Leucobacter insecticola]|uniref:MFS transporter n=1 Tax=Leucobacter insecticola TaxID=2714934 RepID=UPI001980A0E8|nr:MFS transporter [Leucobacter insecticola]